MTKTKNQKVRAAIIRKNLQNLAIRVPPVPRPLRSRVQMSNAPRRLRGPRPRLQGGRRGVQSRSFVPMPALPPVPVAPEVPWWQTALDIVGGVGKVVVPLIKGFGDYSVKSNSLVAAGSAGKMAGEVPRLSNTPTHNVISHREYLGDILSSDQEFVVQTYPINPGLITSFPWLSPIANSYQQYRLKGMVFEFKSLATDYSAQPYIGYVAMATQYDSYDAEFSSKLSLENCEYSSSRKTNESFLHPIECSRDQTTATELYVRNATVSNGDARLYDWGRFSIAVGGQSTPGVTIGELWVTYEIEFFKPKLATDAGFNALSTDWQTTTGVANATPLGTGASPVGSIPVLSLSSTAFTLGVQEGNYVVSFYWAGTAAAITYPSVTGTNCSLTNIMLGPSGGGAVTTAQCHITYLMVVTPGTGVFPKITLGGAGSLPTGVSASSVVYITQLAQAQLQRGPVVSPMKLLPRHVQNDKAQESPEEEVDDLEIENETLKKQVALLRQLMASNSIQAMTTGPLGGRTCS